MIQQLQQSAPNPPDYDVVWSPISGSSQEMAIDTRAHHTLYHGARGPGKTITQIMRFRRFVGMGYGKYWVGVIFDREFKHLQDLVRQGNRFLLAFDDGCEWRKSANDYKWVWPTGEELLLRHVKVEEDYDGFHGHEYPYVGWNELTKHPTPALYDLFMSVNRCSFKPEVHTPHEVKNGEKIYLTPDAKPLPPIPLEVFSTTNPSGAGRNWVKKRFIDVARAGEIVRKDISYEDDNGETVQVERTQVHIFGSFYENPYLDKIYKAGLIQSCERDPNKRKAWIEGSWDVSEGGAFDDLWDARTHVVRRFPIPRNWKIDRSFDWGSSSPFACIWWAEANGETIQWYDQKCEYFEWTPYKGSLIAFAEWYGCGEKENTGLRLPAKKIAEGIREREQRLKKLGWIYREVQAGPADNQIAEERQVDEDSIEIKMQKEGIYWIKSNKTMGSREMGVDLMRGRLDAAKQWEGPAIYFMQNCRNCIDLIPSLPRDADNEEDVDTEAEDHLWDAARYRILKGNNQFSTHVPVKFGRA